MEVLKFLFLAICCLYFCPKVHSEEDSARGFQAPDPTDSSDIELDKLKSKISFLESRIEESTRELKSKDEDLSQLERVIHERSDHIAVLQQKIEFLEQKDSVNAEEQVGKALARTSELEKQVVELRKELEDQNKRKVDLESQVNEAEARIHKLTMKLEELGRVNEDQRNRIRKSERALKVAEEEMLKSKLETVVKRDEILQMHKAWLPHWLAVHISTLKAFIIRHWHAHCKPTTVYVIKKVSEKSAQAQKYTEPLLESMKLKVVPVVMEQWSMFAASVGPYVQLVATKTAEILEMSWTALYPHILNFRHVASLYLQDAKRFCNPYIDQTATLVRPHVNKARAALRPYSGRAFRISKKLFKSVELHHQQMQARVHHQLQKHDLTKSLAIMELEWLLASAVLLLPVYILYKLLSSSRREQRASRSTNTHHGHRRSKRRHADK